MAYRGRPPLRRYQVLSYVRRFMTATGSAPSYGMICQALGIGTRQEVSRIVACLEREGQLSRVGAGKVRRIQLPIYANYR